MSFRSIAAQSVSITPKRYSQRYNVIAEPIVGPALHIEPPDVLGNPYTACACEEYGSRIPPALYNLGSEYS